jgi:hypothetical protein
VRPTDQKKTAIKEMVCCLQFPRGGAYHAMWVHTGKSQGQLGGKGNEKPCNSTDSGFHEMGKARHDKQTEDWLVWSFQ